MARAVVVLLVAVLGFWLVAREFRSGPETTKPGGIACELSNAAAGAPELRWHEVESSDLHETPAPTASYEAVLFARGTDGFEREVARTGPTSETSWTLDRETRTKIPKRFRIEVSAFDANGKLVRHGSCECQR